MSSKTKRFPYLFMTLLLVIAIFGKALPAVGQGSNPPPNYTTGMRKMVRGGAATVDPLTLPTFEFKFTLDTISPGNKRIYKIEDPKFDDRLFIQRIVVNGPFARQMAKIEVHKKDGSGWETKWTAPGGAPPANIPIGEQGSATNAVDVAAAGRLAAQISDFTNGNPVMSNNTATYDQIRFTFKDDGGQGSNFNGAAGKIDLYFRVLNPYVDPSNFIGGSGGVVCPKEPGGTSLRKEIVCNYAKFYGSGGNVPKQRSTSGTHHTLPAGKSRREAARPPAQ